MKNILIVCSGINDVSAEISGRMGVYMSEPNMAFIQDIPVEDIISYADNEKLFKAIIENDGDILTKYLKDNGYGHFYTKG